MYTLAQFINGCVVFYFYIFFLGFFWRFETMPKFLWKEWALSFPHVVCWLLTCVGGLGSEVKNPSDLCWSFHTNQTKGLRARRFDNPAPVGSGAQILSHLASIRTKIFWVLLAFPDHWRSLASSSKYSYWHSNLSVSWRWAEVPHSSNWEILFTRSSLQSPVSAVRYHFSNA